MKRERKKEVEKARYNYVRKDREERKYERERGEGRDVELHRRIKKV